MTRRKGRRGCLRLAIGLPLGLAMGHATAAELPVQTKAEAAYQDTPQGIYMCLTCSHFAPPDRCRVVEGEVAEEGWCRLFELLD
jgi:hypothetical protein